MDNDPLTFTWNFNGGNSGALSSEFEPSGILFDTEALYNVTMIANDGLNSVSITKQVDTSLLKAIKYFYVTNSLLDIETGISNSKIFFECMGDDSNDLIEITFMDKSGEPLTSVSVLNSNCAETGGLTTPSILETGIYKAEINLIPSDVTKTCVNCPVQTTFIVTEEANISNVPDTNPLFAIVILGLVLFVIRR